MDYIFHSEYFWIVLSLLSAIFYAFSNILTKKCMSKNVNSLQIIFEQYLLMFLVLTLIFFNKIDFNSFFNLWYIYILKAITIFLFTIIYFYLLKKFEISKISPLTNLSPLFLFFLSSIFLNEEVKLLQILGVIIIIFSTYILEVNIKFHFHSNPHKYHLKWLKTLQYKEIFLVFIMLLIISFTAILDKSIFNSGVNVYTNMFFTGFLIFIFLSFYYIKEKEFLIILKYIKKEPLTLIISIFSLISTFLILLAISLPNVMVSLVVPLKRTSTLFSAILGGILFHEKHLIKKIFATLFMILGIYLLVI